MSDRNRGMAPRTRAFARAGIGLALGLLGVLGIARGEDPQLIPHAQDRPPGPALSPAEAIRKMTVPPGFTVELVASEPDIVNPVAMTFDERGRVWVTESLEYPRREAGPGRDRIKVLEDTDGDGKADKFTVFAEGLNIPSGIAVGYGGVWVGNSPDLLFLKDTDGDGKADKREVVVTGFGRYDTHELPNSLTWGPDGWLYGLNGVFNQSIVKQGGKTHDFTCAVFRIHPRTREFQLFAEGTSNPWGIALDAEGSIFLSACVIDHLWHMTESGYYHRQGGPYPPHTWKIESIVDYKHQKAAYCGIHYFDSDAYPTQYRERLMMGNIHGNCVNMDRLARSGSTYKGSPEPDFLSANDAWFMPVVQKTGPDGCLYVLDWYDRYHCYQDANRDPAGIDRLKGRLYRVRYQDSPRAPRFDLARESDDQLIERLGSPNVYFRDVAQRVLGERANAATLPRLEALALDDQAPRKQRLHALWALLGTGKIEPSTIAKLLAEPDPTLRAWGVRAAGNLGTVDSELRARLVGLVTDESPDVRLQLVVAASKIEGISSLPVLHQVLASAGDDVLIPRIVWRNLLPLLDRSGKEFLALVERGPMTPPVVNLLPRLIDKLLSAPRLEGEVIAGALGLLARHNPAGAGDAVETLVNRTLNREITGDRLESLKRAIQPRLVDVSDAGLKARTQWLLAAWDDASALSAMAALANSETAAAGDRVQAMRVLIAKQPDQALELAAAVLGSKSGASPGFRAEVVDQLSRLDHPRVAEIVLPSYPAFDPNGRARMIELLIQRPTWAKPLLSAIESKAIPSSALNINQVRRLAGSRDDAIRRQVRTIWGTIREGRNPQREEVVAQMRRFLTREKGDAAAGVAAFNKLCAQCHKIFGEGQEVGPDLTGNGRGSFEQLISNVFDPSLVIGEAYQATTVATKDGRVLSGLKVEDTPERVVLKVQGGKQEIVPRGEVEEIKTSPLSLMPENLETQLSPREIADLFAFLLSESPPKAK